MGKIKVRYLVARQRKRGTRYYWLPTPKLQAAGFMPRRLSDDLREAYAQAEAHNAALDRWYANDVAPRGPAPGSLAALSELFQTDEAFGRLAERTKRDFLYSIRAAIAWAGDEQVAHLSRATIKAWYRDQVATRGTTNARNAIAALRRLLSFGHDEGWIAENPALKMLIKAPPSRERLWTLAERDAFCAAARGAGRPSMAAAVMLGWCLGQRPDDLRTLAWTAYDGRAIAIRQAKTRRRISIPALPELREMLDAMPRSAVQIVVSERTGRPYRESDFQHTFADIRALAGLPADLQFRDLRRTLATALGAAGCTDDEIRGVTGHVTRGVVAVYVRPDSTFAEGAMRRLERAGRGKGA